MHEFSKIDLSNFDLSTVNILKKQNIEISPSSSIQNIYTPIDYAIKKFPATYREIYEIKIPTDIEWHPGDAIGLRPPNNQITIEKFFKIFKQKNEIYEIKRRNYFFAGSLYDFFKFEACPMQMISKRFLRQWYEDVKNPLLLYLSAKGIPEYIKLSKYSIFDLIDYFGPPTLNTFLSHVEIIKPRYFSVIEEENKNCHFLLGILEGGRCSEYFPANTVFFKELISKRPSKLLSFDAKEKSLFIATGVGIAAFLWYYKNSKDFLIYGFRNENDNLASYYDIKNYLPFRSAKGEYVSDYFQDDHLEKFDRIYICGNIEMMKSIYRICEKKYPEIIKRKKFYFDSWL